MKTPGPKVLVIRLSSLGDILLATSFLENLPEDAQVDWVVRSEFEFALKGHPKIHRLIPFARNAGFAGWMKLVKTLSTDSYAMRADLHRNLRSTIAMLYFRMTDLLKFQWTTHRRVSKERIRTFIYFIMKEWSPQGIRPRPYWLRFGKLANALPSPPKPPSFLPILAASGHDERRVLSEYDLFPGKYFAVMPAASARAKEWNPQYYHDLIKSYFSDMTPVLVGRENDVSCIKLRELFRSSGIFFKDVLAEADFKKTAILLKSAEFYLGSDTGLAHLAEAVGTKSFVIFGPTRPSLGFGPWRPESKSIFLKLGCSPCSKDGNLCYRFFSPHACLKKLEPAQVKREISQ